ncbi:ATP12-domain-containing protein [Xylariaceae sp. FL0016]|nr:ATP12-domain-containing protein [Xylariaceae sp. FL0016]
MKPPANTALRLVARPGKIAIPFPVASTTPISLPATTRSIHHTSSTPATVSPGHGAGPPPPAPQPAADSADARIERRRRQAALLEKAKEARIAHQASSKTGSAGTGTGGSSGSRATDRAAALLRKRFWRDVHVREVEGMWEVHLDARALRHPGTKKVVRLPLSKPALAGALALEWDALTSAQQATRQHLIPLTSLVCRALDIADDDAARATGHVYGESVRAGIARMLMRYLDTDSLLCWAPAPRADEAPDAQGLSLRDRQQRAAEEVVGYLSTRVWPGVEIEPVLDDDSIMPRGQNPATRQIVEGWVMGLSNWELAGLERGVLAGKGLLGAARLLVEWSEGFVGAARDGEKRAFGVEEAARLASIEVDWQTGNWGEVEDTHDVEKEDLRRQLGSVVLLVSGTGRN